ncbi:hypothetical protein HKX48_005365 [Thoreauomyces humboldtii]|nr:hypothetical protein HKX48_005365 [Thoreauomyces humboldtii]
MMVRPAVQRFLEQARSCPRSYHAGLVSKVAGSRVHRQLTNRSHEPAPGPETTPKATSAARDSTASSPTSRTQGSNRPTAPHVTRQSSPTSTITIETTDVPRSSPLVTTTGGPKDFFKSKSSLTAHVSSSYPWLLSTSPARRPSPTFWTALRDKHFLAVGTARARKHLNHPTYDFPTQFNDDAAQVTKRMIGALSDPTRAGDPQVLKEFMVGAVAERFAAGHRSMTENGARIGYVLKGEPKIAVTGTHFTYGPYPVPAGYVGQQWWSLIELVIPREDEVFTSHPRQQQIMRRAMDDGVYFKVDVRCDLDVEFVVTDERTGMPLLRDTRRRVELQFVSPHFTPWDEVFELDGDGEWMLRWNWRVSDIDWLVESATPKVKEKHKIDWHPKHMP